MAKLTRFIKYNRNLPHLDLSYTGLNELVLRTIGVSLRRWKSILALYLSGNLGVTKDLKEYLHARIRCKPVNATMSYNEQEGFNKAVNIALEG